jgi:nucleotide-binding universal stress UspA family protein
MLAYSNSPKAKEALFIAAYMAGKWHSRLSVLTIDSDRNNAVKIQSSARAYLEQLEISADFICLSGENHAQTIVTAAEDVRADTIMMGGYEAAPLVEIVVGSIVDQVLRKASIPVLLCR